MKTLICIMKTIISYTKATAHVLWQIIESAYYKHIK